MAGLLSKSDDTLLIRLEQEFPLSIGWRLAAKSVMVVVNIRQSDDIQSKRYLK
jgi:hypothetical protein